MKYRNISLGVIPIPGRGEIQPNKVIDLSDEELQLSEIAIYIGKYLSPILTTVAEPVIPPKPTIPIASSNAVVEGGKQGIIINSPPDKTDKELAEEKQKEENEQVVAVKRSKKTKDGSVVQTVQEVTKGKIRWAREKLRDMTSWQKKVKYIESIDNVALLEIILPNLTGKVEETAKKRIMKLRRKK